MVAQLQFPAYILENRPPTLTELCDLLPETPSSQQRKHRNIFKRKLVYPANWQEISSHYKAKAKYRCQICGLQCLQPKDSRDNLTLSQAARLTLNLHHSNGNTMDNREQNLIPLCTADHLRVHRGTGGVPPIGQGYLFDICQIQTSSRQNDSTIPNYN